MLQNRHYGLGHYGRKAVRVESVPQVEVVDQNQITDAAKSEPAANPVGEKEGAATSQKVPQNLTNRVLDGLLWTTSSYGVQAVLRLLVVTVLARLLTPEDFGLTSAAGIVLGLASYITEFGLFSVIEQRSVIEERHLRTA